VIGATKPKRLKKFKKFLEDSDFDITEPEFEMLINHFKYISDIRNLFVHGHPVTKTFGDGKITVSDAKEYLTRQKFNETRGIANKIAEHWNDILQDLQAQENILQKSELPRSTFLMSVNSRCFKYYGYFERNNPRI
jgi:hypothetical protein